MPATIEEITDTKRRLTFTLPESDVDTEILERLKSLQKTTMLPGFRKGKAPLKIIDTRFRSDVKAEVLNDLVSMQVNQTLHEQAVPVYSRPYVEKLSNDEVSSDYDISVIFETYPEFTKKDIRGELVEIPEIAMSEAEYDQRLEELREYFHDWEQVERKPQHGDYVVFSWAQISEPDDALDDVARRLPLLIGEERIPDLEDALQHMEIGEIKIIDLAKENDPSDDSTPVEPVLNKVRLETVSMPLKDKFSKDALVDLFGVESEDDDRLRERLKLYVRRECKATLRKVKEVKVKELLLAANESYPPESAVALNLANLLERSGMNKEKALMVAIKEELPEELQHMKQVARERLKFVWIVQEIASDLGLIGVRREELAELMLREEAEDYPDPEQAYNEMLPITQQYEEICVTREVIDTLLEDADVRNIPMNYWELIKLDNEVKESTMNELQPGGAAIQPESETEIETAESVIVDAHGNPIRR